MLAKFYGAEKKILSLSTYLGYDVPDPYGLSLDAYEQIYKTFSAVLCEIFAKCEKNKVKIVVENLQKRIIRKILLRIVFCDYVKK